MKVPLDGSDGGRVALICRVGNCLIALPITQVVETMRPLAIEPLAGAPAAVLGVSIIRGTAVPVVDAASLLLAQEGEPTRFVLLSPDRGSTSQDPASPPSDSGERWVALAVDAVLDARTISAQWESELPPLLQEANPDVLSATGVAAGELMLILQSAYLVPDSVWSALERAGVPA